MPRSPQNKDVRNREYLTPAAGEQSMPAAGLSVGMLRRANRIALYRGQVTQPKRCHRSIPLSAPVIQRRIEKDQRAGDFLTRNLGRAFKAMHRIRQNGEVAV